MTTTKGEGYPTVVCVVLTGCALWGPALQPRFQGTKTGSARARLYGRRGYATASQAARKVGEKDSRRVKEKSTRERRLLRVETRRDAPRLLPYLWSPIAASSAADATAAAASEDTPAPPAAAGTISASSACAAAYAAIVSAVSSAVVRMPVCRRSSAAGQGRRRRVAAQSVHQRQDGEPGSQW